MSFSPRQSPFRRAESPVPRSPSTVRAASPTMSSPTKGFQSPSKPTSPMLSPERQSPFVRRPSQLGNATERPKSPFARPASRLSVAETPEPESQFDADPFVAPSPTPAARISPPLFGSAPASKPAQSVTSPPLASMPTLRPAMQRSTTSSTAATMIPAQHSTPNTTTRPIFTGGSNYSHIPPALLRSMRESFEVLDAHNSGTITAADVSAMMEQMGMDINKSAVHSFFPPSGPSNLNLARFLDTLAGTMSDLSPPEELLAAFEAFDVDDSGQIDLAELRDAVLRTVPEDGSRGIRLSEREVDGVLGEFTGRRAFGGKGVLGKDMGGAGKRGEVFRYKDFMNNVSGAGAAAEGVAACEYLRRSS